MFPGRWTWPWFNQFKVHVRLSLSLNAYKNQSVKDNKVSKVDSNHPKIIKKKILRIFSDLKNLKITLNWRSCVIHSEK